MVREWMQFQTEGEVRDVGGDEPLLDTTPYKPPSPTATSARNLPTPWDAADSHTHQSLESSQQPPAYQDLKSRRSIFAAMSQSRKARPLNLAQVGRLQPGAFSETVSDANKRGAKTPGTRGGGGGRSRAGSFIGSGAPSRRASVAGSHLTDLHTCAQSRHARLSSIAIVLGKSEQSLLGLLCAEASQHCIACHSR